MVMEAQILSEPDQLRLQNHLLEKCGPGEEGESQTRISLIPTRSTGGEWGRDSTALDVLNRR
jgi:hypothetical protein